MPTAPPVATAARSGGGPEGAGAPYGMSAMYGFFPIVHSPLAAS
jgi:hypothetical protein